MNISEVAGCMILFVTIDERDFINRINKIIPDNPVLIVAEEEGMASKGACINLVMAEEHLKLEINQKNIERRHLKIAMELLGLGTAVQ